MGRNLTPTGGASDLTGCPANATSYGMSNYPGLNGGSLSIKTCYASYALQTNFHAYSYLDSVLIGDVSVNTSMMVGLILYNGTDWASSPKWTFDYVSRAPNDPSNINYGDLSKVTLPTGGTITYSWSNEDQCSNADPVTPVSRVISSRAVDDSINGSNQKTTTWSAGRNIGTDPAGNDTVHTFTSLNASCSLYETQTQYYKGLHTTGTLLKTVTTDYSSVGNPYNFLLDAPTAVNVHPIRVTTTWPNGQVTKVETDYDSTFNGTYTAGNVTEKREYDYGNGAAGALLRRTDYTYSTANSNYLNENVLGLVTQATVYDGSGNRMAQTNYTFDGTTLQSSGVSQNHTTGASYPGNLTLVQKWLNTTGGLVTVSNIKFYDTGMPYQSFDLKNNATTFSYSPTYYGAYLTQTQSPNTGSGNSITHIISGTYDFNTGLLTSLTDQNNQTSNYGYDVLGRATSGSYPDGGAVTINYTDSVPVQISKTVKVTSALNQVANTIFDGLGRVSQTQFHDPDCTAGSQLVKTDHTYGFDMGQNTTFSTATTPYCDTPGTVYGLSTRTDADALGRVIKVTQTDGAVASTSYTGNCTTVTDEAGKSRKTCSDGLGRTTGAWEDPNGLNYETDYGYNTLNNLLSVTQKGNDPISTNWRPRAFTYDSLSRLLSTSNPEYGNSSSTTNLSINYTYSNTSSGCSADPSTVCTKAAPTPNATTGTTSVTTTYVYDNLDRLTKKTYSDATPIASYGYDADTSTLTCANVPSLTDSYPKGQHTAMCDGSGATAWSHDKMGRSLTEKRLINGSSAITNSILYSYNLDGSAATLTYPSGRVIAYTPNSLSSYTAGRALSAVDTANGINYVTAAKYAPQGNLSSLANGSSISGAITYNTRLQPLQMYYTTGTISSGTLSQLQGSTCPTTTATIMSTNYNFGLGTNDNGNVQSVTNCRNTNRTQNFVYDNLNRISQGYSSGTNWGEDFTIDPWGNLTNRALHSGKTNYEPLNAASATTHNQLPGFGYDIAGNMVSNGTASYTYDAENRLISTAGYAYTYDGKGERVKKASGSTGTLYWKGMGSDPIAESNLSGTMQEEYIFFGDRRVARRDVSGGAVHYYFSDHLGSHGVVMNATGSTCEQDIDYYPFGGVEQDYCPTVSQNYKFTGKERDSESGLDNFGARYDASSLGRFMTPDWDARPVTVPYAVFGDPQSLNLYAYVRNDPVSRADADGHSGDLPLPPSNPMAAGQGGVMNAEDPGTAVARDRAVLEAQGYHVVGMNANAGWFQVTAAQKQGEGSLPNLARRAAIAATAQRHEGDTSMPYTDDHATCNLFCQRAVTESGAPKPEVMKADGKMGAPSAAELSGDRVPSGWRLLKKGESPLPGDIAARKEHFVDATGHSGIVVSVKDGVVTVMAAHAKVIGKDMSFQPGSKVYHNAFLRYTGD